MREVRLRISWDGASVERSGRLLLAEHELLAEVDTVRIRLPYASIHGADLRLSTLTIFADRATIAASDSDRLQSFRIALCARACALPELTVGLRALGSHRGGDPDLQGRFFAPLLAARRRLEGQDTVEWRLAAFDADDLRRQTMETLREMVAEFVPNRAPARRSLEAQVLDEAEPLLNAMDALGEAAYLVRSADDARSYLCWRSWAARARDVFVQADRCWMAVWPLLAGSPTLRRRGWSGRGAPGRGSAGGAIALAAGLVQTLGR